MFCGLNPLYKDVRHHKAAAKRHSVSIMCFTGRLYGPYFNGRAGSGQELTLL